MPEKERSLNEQVLELLALKINTALAAAAETDALRVAACRRLNPEIVTMIDTVFAHESLSYRDALAVQLAYGVASPTHVDLTRRGKGARSVAKKLGDFLASKHIRCVKDAFQNIGKNTPDLVRGNLQAFDDLLLWATEAGRPRADLDMALSILCVSIASIARRVLSMPELDAAKLDFAGTSRLLDRMLDSNSGGANEQFIVAALLHALVTQIGISGIRVDTKNLNASDRSSRVAGDIQLLAGNRILEAFEVTANEWTDKVAQAGQTIREHDLSRLHVVAKRSRHTREQTLEKLGCVEEDVSVLDLGHFALILVASLTRQNRSLALHRLYDLLDRLQPDANRVNDYVDELERCGLTFARPSASSA